MHKKKNILVTGASGLIGRSLCRKLREMDYKVRTISRTHGDHKWDITSGIIDSSALNNIDCVIHLAGETIACRWTSAVKERILQSRIKSTQLLIQEILKQKRPVSLICASGINYYGFDNPGPLSENSPPGTGFLADVCRQWEAAATSEGLVSKIIRTGIVLTPEGGMLRNLLPLFKSGLGGSIGSGRQMMSWISLEDITDIYIRAVEDDALTGAINAVTPNAISNRNFTKAAGKALHRPVFLNIPPILIKMIFGEMGRETILSNLHVKPQKLEHYGFKWKHPDISFLLEQEL